MARPTFPQPSTCLGMDVAGWPFLLWLIPARALGFVMDQMGACMLSGGHRMDLKAITRLNVMMNGGGCGNRYLIWWREGRTGELTWWEAGSDTIVNP